MKRYAIWNKQDPMITPKGEVFTAEEWISQYPAAGVDSIQVVCGGGEINGDFFGTLGRMVEIYTGLGCDFTGCETGRDKLDAIEAYEDVLNTPPSEPTAEERIAAAMEYQNLLSM